MVDRRIQGREMSEVDKFRGTGKSCAQGRRRGYIGKDERKFDPHYRRKPNDRDINIDKTLGYLHIRNLVVFHNSLQVMKVNES